MIDVEPAFDVPEMGDAEYPELERMKYAREQLNSEQIADFITWLEEVMEIRLAEYRHDPHFGRKVLEEIRLSTEDLMAAAFGIDMDKVEKERCQLLEKFRNEQ